MSEQTKKDVAVIGGGPAGYSAAVRAAQLGARVTLVEKDKLGGACLNWACIPTKLLLHSVELYRSVKKAELYGVGPGSSGIDLEKLNTRKDAVIAILTGGISQLMSDNGVEVIQGQGCLTSASEIMIKQDSGLSRKINAASIIIATGSVPAGLKTPGVESTAVLYARDILELKRIPDSLIMVGAGAVGVELATILSGLGCKVTLLEIMPHILPCEDGEITPILERTLKKDGVELYTGAAIRRIENGRGTKRVLIKVAGDEKMLEAADIAVAIGQKPYLDGLGLAELGVRIASCGIEVNEHMATSVSAIYAAGDVTGKSMLAYTAMAEGRAAAENALGLNSKMNYDAIPHCVFSLPELASVGLTEAEALSRGYKIRCGRSQLAANAAATILGERRGMVKIVAEAVSGKILGVHIVGNGASELIAECTLALGLGASVKDLQTTLHAHPTLSEAVWEAALNLRV